jgi:hypothetical protein
MCQSDDQPMDIHLLFQLTNGTKKGVIFCSCNISNTHIGIHVHIQQLVSTLKIKMIFQMVLKNRRKNFKEKYKIKE